jgi:hypothetical protein
MSINLYIINFNYVSSPNWIGLQDHHAKLVVRDYPIISQCLCIHHFKSTEFDDYQFQFTNILCNMGLFGTYFCFLLWFRDFF